MGLGNKQKYENWYLPTYNCITHKEIISQISKKAIKRNSAYNPWQVYAIVMAIGDMRDT